MDYVCLYSDCNKVLSRLFKNDQILFDKELLEISPNYASSVIQEFLDKNIAKWDSVMKCFIDINKDVVLRLYRNRYYERLADKYSNERKRDSLYERSTISAERSADAAQKSAESANKSRIWAIISAVGTLISAGIAVFALFR